MPYAKGTYLIPVDPCDAPISWRSPYTCRNALVIVAAYPTPECAVHGVKAGYSPIETEKKVNSIDIYTH